MNGHLPSLLSVTSGVEPRDRGSDMCSSFGLARGELSSLGERVSTSNTISEDPSSSNLSSFVREWFST